MNKIAIYMCASIIFFSCSKDSDVLRGNDFASTTSEEQTVANVIEMETSGSYSTATVSAPVESALESFQIAVSTNRVRLSELVYRKDSLEALGIAQTAIYGDSQVQMAARQLASNLYPTASQLVHSLQLTNADVREIYGPHKTLATLSTEEVVFLGLLAEGLTSASTRASKIWGCVEGAFFGAAAGYVFDNLARGIVNRAVLTSIARIAVNRWLRNLSILGQIVTAAEFVMCVTSLPTENAAPRHNEVKIDDGQYRAQTGTVTQNGYMSQAGLEPDSPPKSSVDTTSASFPTFTATAAIAR